jgi:hypothetical protein
MTRAIALCAALGLLLAACGHYGQAVRPKPEPARSAAQPPADEDPTKDEP